jgi:hypothetical protein
MPSYASNNAIIGANNRSKRAEVPLTITSSATVNQIVITPDTPYLGIIENVNGASGTDSATGSLSLDTSAVFLGLAKFAANVGVWGFVLLDAGLELQGAGLPLPGNATNISYGTAVVLGTAKYLRSARLTFTDLTAGALAAGSPNVGLTMECARANLGVAGVTPNGNLQIVVKNHSVTIATTTATAAAFNVAGQVWKAILEIVWD